MILEDRREVDRDIEETLGLVPEFFKRVPDYLLPTEWASFKNLQLSDQTAIPNKYKELIGLAVSGATRCRYCAYFHTEAARLFGATEDEVSAARAVLAAQAIARAIEVPILGFLAINTEDNVLHLLLGITGPAAGFATSARPAATRPRAAMSS